MYRFYSRRFLNLRGHHAGAYVLAIVEARTEKNPDAWPDISLEFADCSRRVSFDFPLHSAADRRNSVRKARLIAEVATRFAEALEVEAELEAARPRPKRMTRPWRPGSAS